MDSASSNPKSSERQNDSGLFVPYVPHSHESPNLWQRMWRFPWVTLGAFTTAGILLMGVMSMRTGDSRRSQLFMRARVVAQGVTLGLAAYATQSMVTPSKKKEIDDNPHILTEDPYQRSKGE